MEIKNTLQKLVDPYAQVQKNKQALTKGTQGASPAQATGDRVSFSPEAKLMQEAHATAMNAPEIRQEKVDALKAKVGAGTYTIDSKNVAKKLLQSEAELFAAIEK